MINKTIDIFTIDSNYINFLFKFDNNVMFNQKKGTNKRPYVGILLNFGNYLYFAPLTHDGKKWIGYKDHIILANGDLGAIKIGRMVPISRKFWNQVLSLSIRSKYLCSRKKADKQYGHLLTKQYKEINRILIKKLIVEAALKIHDIQKPYPYMCNFKILENAATLWTWKYKSIIWIINLFKNQ